MNKLLIAILLISAISVNAHVRDSSALYELKTKQGTFDGIRELSTDDDTRTFSFKDTSAIIKAEFYSEFIDNKGVIQSISYDADFRFLLIRRNSNFKFDNEKSVLNSTGEYDWETKLPNKLVYDPLNAQLEMRYRLQKQETEFDLLLPEIKNGEIKSYKYKVIGEENYNLNGLDYECIVVQRIREEDNRVTIYIMAKELDFLIMQVTNQDPDDGEMTLTIKEILSFG